MDKEAGFAILYKVVQEGSFSNKMTFRRKDEDIEGK